jgi:hypothetical protein
MRGRRDLPDALKDTQRLLSLAYMIELSERPAQRTPSHRWTLDALRAALAAGRARQAICMFLEAAEDYARRFFESLAVWRESHVFRDRRHFLLPLTAELQTTWQKHAAQERGAVVRAAPGFLDAVV